MWMTWKCAIAGIPSECEGRGSPTIENCRGRARADDASLRVESLQ